MRKKLLKNMFRKHIRLGYQYKNMEIQKVSDMNAIRGYRSLLRSLKKNYKLSIVEPHTIYHILG